MKKYIQIIVLLAVSFLLPIGVCAQHFDFGFPFNKFELNEGETLTMTPIINQSKSPAGASFVKIDYYWDDELINSKTNPPYDLNYRLTNQSAGKHILKLAVYATGTNLSTCGPFNFEYPITINETIDSNVSVRHDNVARQEVMGIELSNTTFADFDQIMRSRGYVGEAWSYYKPGKVVSYKKVTFDGIKNCEVLARLDENLSINTIEIRFPSHKTKKGKDDPNKALYRQYLLKFTNQYGEPEDKSSIYPDKESFNHYLMEWKNTPFRLILLSYGLNSLELSFCLQK